MGFQFLGYQEVLKEIEEREESLAVPKISFDISASLQYKFGQVTEG